MNNAKTLVNFHSILNSVVDDIGNVVQDLVSSDLVSASSTPSDTKRYIIGKEIIVDPMVEWEKRRSVLKKNRSNEKQTISFDRGFPVKKVKRKRRSQVTMVDTTRLKPLPTVARLSKPYASSSVTSTRTTSSDISIVVRRGLK